jgi:hypothetical protein
MTLTFRDYLDCIDDIENCLYERFGEDARWYMENFAERIPLDLSDKYRIYTDINEMVFGQFTTVEVAFTGRLSNREAMKFIATNIIRPLEDKVFDNEDKEKENRHIGLLMSEPAKDVIEVCNLFAENRKTYLHETFKGVFYLAPSEDDEEEDEKNDNKTETLEEYFNKEWYWYQVKDLLANNDITKHDEIEMMVMGRVAPHLAYLRIKGKIEYKQMKDEQLKRNAHG